MIVRALARAWLLAALALPLAACVTTDDQGVIQSKPKANLAEAAQINTQLGIDYMRKGQDDLAEEKLLRAKDQNPNLAQTSAALGFLYARRGDYALAEKQYRRALELEDDPATRSNFGVFLCGQKRLDDAYRQFLQAAQDKRNRTPEVALSNAGVCARRNADLAKADGFFRQALAANKAFPDALAQMAWLSYQQKSYLQARAFLQRYQQVGKPSPETLWVGVLTEQALGDPEAARAYERRLKQEFPESEESGRLPPQMSSP